MSLLRARLCLMAGLFAGVCLVSGCGGSTEPVVIEAAPDAPAVDPSADSKAQEEAMKDYDPRSGSPPVGGGTSSPSTI